MGQARPGEGTPWWSAANSCDESLEQRVQGSEKGFRKGAELTRTGMLLGAGAAETTARGGSEA